MKKDILNFEVEADGVRNCVDDIMGVLETPNGGCSWMACLNPHSYVVSRNDIEFAKALRKADWLVPDGAGIVLAGRILKTPLHERITGFDIFGGVMAALDRHGGTVFFLGGTEKTLSLIEENLAKDYPGVTLAGSYSPPFKPQLSDQDNAEILTAIIQAQPDVLWVAMTAPKQEKWIAEHAGQLPVAFVGAIGAVFDFYTGQVKRSHPVFQKMGLEWLPRLLQQPRRLWRRTFVSAPVFLTHVFLNRFVGKANDSD